MQDPTKIRNIAIIAHVDHGKTTLVDGLLKESKTFRDNQVEMGQELIMDSGDQEKERGITITAKITAVNYEDYRINIIDTPGHADFSGEVERTLNMADGCLLIVDAQEGPMPQTKFVLKKALEGGLKPIVIINKIDKPGSRIEEVKDELDNLFLELASSEEQLHYPIYYAIGRESKAWDDLPSDPTNQDADLSPVFKAIIEHVPAPNVEPDKPFQMLVTALAWDTYKGKYAIGKISRGQIKAPASIVLIKKDGQIKQAKVDGVMMSHGLSRFEVEKGEAGDIVQLTGISDAQIGETLADPNTPDALPVIEVEAPTLKIYLGPNTSPFKGKEGEFTTSRQIKERLDKELETNVGLLVEDADLGFIVSGRGELHLSVLIETMRREGYEFEVGRPQVVTKESNGIIEEPLEELIIEVPAEHVGAVQMELGSRRATLKEQHSLGSATRLTYEMPTRAMIGLRSVLLTNTKGTATLNSLLIGYQKLGAELPRLRNGVIIASDTGITTPYALQTVEERGTCFVEPAVSIYEGQIVGLNSRTDDLEVNATKAKQLTNMRSKSSDGVVQLTPPTILSLEQALDFIEKDELLEVTPKSLRLRKKLLRAGDRKRK